MDIIKNGFINHHKVLEDTMDLIPVVQKMAEICLNSLRNGNKILICGNGGISQIGRVADYGIAYICFDPSGRIIT